MPNLERPASPATVTPDADAVAQTLALLQPWIEYVPRQQRRLGIFILLAFFASLTASFFIRIDTMRAELRHQPRTHVTVEDPQAASLTGQPVDSFWDRLADPRLFLFPQQPLAGLNDAPPLDFDTLNSNLGSHDLPPAALPADFQFIHPLNPPLEQQVDETMRPPRQPFSYEEAPRPIAAKTTWVWDDALAARAPSGLPDLPSPVTDTDLNPTQLLVAVDPSGTVEHVLVEQSSGELGASMAKELDQQAVLAARKIRFRFTDQPGQLWGRITIFWNYSTKPSEEVVPTPPSGP
jgi:TonB family protein